MDHLHREREEEIRREIEEEVRKRVELEMRQRIEEEIRLRIEEEMRHKNEDKLELQKDTEKETLQVLKQKELYLEKQALNYEMEQGKEEVISCVEQDKQKVMPQVELEVQQRELHKSEKMENTTHASFFCREEDAAEFQQFDTRDGASDMKGGFFEVNVASLMFLKGMFETGGFYLATNMDEAGAFDDIVFKFKDRNINKCHTYTCFLQLKTKLNKVIKSKDFIASAGDFSLLKYFESYYQIEKEFTMQTSSVVFEGSFDNCEFVIYTNTNLECEDSWYEISARKNPENILNSAGRDGKIFCLKIGSEEDKRSFKILESYKEQLQEILEGSFSLVDIRKKLEEFKQLSECKQLLKVHKNEDIFNKLLNDQLHGIGDRAKWEQFLKKLKVYTCQAIEKELEDEVKKRLEMYCGTNGTRTQEILTKLNEGMLHWWRKETFFLRECYAPFWRAIMEARLTDLIKPLSRKLAGVAVLKFQDTSDLSHRGQITYIVTQGTASLSCLKVHQALTGVGHIMIDSNTLQSRLSEVLSFWGRGTWHSVLVVEGEMMSQHVIVEVLNILDSCKDKQLVLITSESNASYINLFASFQYKNLSKSFSLSQQDTNDFSHRGQITYIVTQGTTSLSCHKVHQALTGVGHIMIDSNTLQSRLSEVLSFWGRGTWHNVLVVQGEMKSQHVIVEVLNILDSCKDKQLVLITSESNASFVNFFVAFQYKILSESFSLSQLDNNSQKVILDSKVNFQGSSIRLNSLASFEILQDAVNADVVVELLTGDLKVGVKVAVPDDCYIPRTLLRRECVDRGILTSKGIGCLAVSGTSVEELQQLMPPSETVMKFDRHSTRKSKYRKCRCFVIDGADDFTELRNWFAKDFSALIFKAIHWLHLHGDNFRWKISKGDITSIVNHATNVAYRNWEKIMDLPEQVVLIVAEPGMGKSTELSYVASSLKRVDPAMWVVRVDLNSHTDFLRNDQNNTFELLATAGLFNKKFQRKLFEHQVHQGGNVVVMFDGFDEISPKFAGKVTDILRDLTATKIKKLFVTSRPVMKDRLEQNFLCLHFSFEPFSPGSQRKFLLKLWKAVKGPYDMNDFISNLLNLTGRSLNDRLSSFTGIPLQTKMLAEAFETKAEQFCKTGEMKLPHKLDLLKLYNTFIDRKWEIYYSEKNRVVISKGGASDDYDYLRERFHKDHMSCALVTLLDLDEVKKLENSDGIIKKCNKFLDGFKTGRDKTGIVVDVVHDTAVFVHRTFVEYFVALWFCKNFEQNRNYLQTILCDPSFQIVRQFFDRMLANKFKLHVAVLNLDKMLVHSLLEEQRVDVNIKDDGGRTALHLAVMSFIDKLDDSCSSILQEITSFLLDCDAKQDIEDNVFCWRPLRLADSIEAFAAMNLLLERQIDNSDLVLTKQKRYLGRFVWRVLELSAKQGYVQLIAFMLQCGVNVGQHFSVKYEYGCCVATMLHEAARHGHLPLVEFLLANNAEIESQFRNFDRRTPLMWAAENGRLQVVKFLIDQGAIVTARNRYDNTALLLAARGGQFEVFNLLSEHDTNMTGCNKDGNTVLHFAAMSGNRDLTRHILDTLPLDINGGNKELQTPIWLAAESGQLQVTQLLWERGANLEVQDKLLRTPFHAAVQKGHIQVCKYLIQHLAKLNVRDFRSRTALLTAARAGKPAIYNLLSHHDTRWTAHDTDGNTVLHLAAMSGSRQLTCHVLDTLPLDIDWFNKKGQTALWLAAKHNRLEVVKFLCERGACVHVQDAEMGYTPLHIAAKMGHLQVTQCLVNTNTTACNKKGNNILHLAAMSGNRDLTRHILDTLPLDINGGNKKLQTPIWLAAELGRFEVTQLLWERGANLDAQDEFLRTPLHAAVQKGSYIVCKYLIQRLAKLNVRDFRSRTALLTAAESGKQAIYNLLSRHDTHWTAHDTDGNTVLHLAAISGDIELTNHILNTVPLDIDSSNKKGQTALLLAVEHKRSEIVKLLHERGACE